MLQLGFSYLSASIVTSHSVVHSSPPLFSTRHPLLYIVPTYMVLLMRVCSNPECEKMKIACFMTIISVFLAPMFRTSLKAFKDSALQNTIP